MALWNFRRIRTNGENEDAIRTSTPGEAVWNFGLLRTRGDLADGIAAEGEDIFVRNLRTIETSGLGAKGISALGDSVRVVNYGSVTTLGGLFDQDASVDGDEVYSDAISVGGNGHSIVNYGQVRVEGQYSSALSGEGEQGSIANYYRLESSGPNSAVMSHSGFAGTSTNAGVIEVDGDDSVGMLTIGDAMTAVNVGRILIEADGSGGIQANGMVANTTNQGQILAVGNASFGLGASGDEHNVTNSGDIDVEGAFASGIRAQGLYHQITNEGLIETAGEMAIGITVGLIGGRSAYSGDAAVTNSGVIATEGDGAAGIALLGNGYGLVNTGSIVTNGGEATSAEIGSFRAAGVVVAGDGITIENAEGGTIASENAASPAVEMNVVVEEGLSAEFFTASLVNAGLISAPDVAIRGGAGMDDVTNTGQIIGDVDLGEGDDVFEFGAGGTLLGELFLGAGDDFVFVNDGAGAVRIADFEAGATGGDQLDLTAFFATVEDALASSGEIAGDVVIALDDDDSLTLADTTLSALGPDDFWFGMS